jgi:hypothetical protein
MSARVAVILASCGRGRVFEASVAGFLREVGGLGDVILVTTADGAAALGMAAANVRVVPSSGRLVPELWRDGLRVVDADRVAFSTTQMVPRAGWLCALMDRMDESEAWGVGGAIAAGTNLGPIDLAVYIQRHLRYCPGYRLPARPSGENALYRRDRLVEVEDAWSRGFWEAEVQGRLDGRGATWASEPRGIVDYAGTNRLREIAGQRVAHARRFGAVRMAGRGRAERWARVLAAPLVPPVLLGRAARGLLRRRMNPGPWLKAVPSFLVIASAWSIGEAIGALGGDGHRRITWPDPPN